MKKIISVLLLALTLSLFSSCIIVGDDSIFTPVSKHDITCYNDTSKIIYDWCVKKDDDSTYVNDEENCEIKPQKRDTIKNLNQGYYKLCFSFKDKIKLNPYDYQESDYTYLDEDVEFSIAERTFYSRSASSPDLENLETQYVVIINGKEYPLTKK